MTDDEDDGHDLVMPFVACVSNGGPFDDDAFTAGYQAGLLDKALEVLAAAGASELPATVFTPLLPQLDLVAMRHGFQLTAVPAEDTGTWSFVTFRRAEEPAG
jgi:hypothetical protein